MAARTNKVEPSDSWKKGIQASMLLNRLKDHGDGKVKLTATQVKAIEVILDRITPKLSAVEQTVTDPRDALTEDQLVAQLSAMFAAKPALLDRIVALRNAATLVSESDEVIASASSQARETALVPVGMEPPTKNA